jgi:hypothetical protein
MGDTEMTQLDGFDAEAQNSSAEVVLVSRAVIHQKTILSLIKLILKSIKRGVTIGKNKKPDITKFFQHQSTADGHAVQCMYTIYL